ncbi:hypothetical protein [Natrarchaeobius oligotrophus]|uniref:Uncharacterized protein n=1 Tax=Natrarchaeobius chitinivorans TaxID=1679083 RepID=A0A3N6PGP3_NATCH|nr:hypothetical protein [Natrarchaeobius chitinivorans]RQG96955.1 hypothetical protein EA472_19830 [Natrarchaeobius chitinivorans]
METVVLAAVNRVHHRALIKDELQALVEIDERPIVEGVYDTLLEINVPELFSVVAPPSDRGREKERILPALVRVGRIESETGNMSAGRT